MAENDVASLSDVFIQLDGPGGFARRANASTPNISWPPGWGAQLAVLSVHRRRTSRLRRAQKTLNTNLSEQNRKKDSLRNRDAH